MVWWPRGRWRLAAVRAVVVLLVWIAVAWAVVDPAGGGFDWVRAVVGSLEGLAEGWGMVAAVGGFVELVKVVCVDPCIL